MFINGVPLTPIYLLSSQPGPKHRLTCKLTSHRHSIMLSGKYCLRDAVPDNMQSTMNTQAPSHVATSKHFQSSELIDHPATSEYAGCSVPRLFPPANVVNPGDPQNGPQFPGFWRPQAQVQPYSAPHLPCNPPFGPSPEAASTSRVTTSGQSTNQNELQGDTSLSRWVSIWFVVIRCL